MTSKELSRNEMDAYFAGLWPPRTGQMFAQLQRVFFEEPWSRAASLDWKDSATGVFERRFADLNESKHCLAVNNGTSALEMCLRALGVKPGDEVIVPALSFVASATAISACGAVPHFVDVDPNSLNLSAAEIERACGPKTVGVLCVHLAGVPCDLDSLADVCRKRKLFLVEDCSHAHGSRWNGRPVGNWGAFGVFSLQQGKTLCCGEGAAVTMNDSALLQALFSQHTFASSMSNGIVDRFDSVVPRNCRLPNLLASLLLPQLDMFGATRNLRRKQLELFNAEIGGPEELRQMEADERASDVCGYYTTYRYAPHASSGVSSSELIGRLNELGVPAFRGHNFPMYQREPYASGRVPYRRAECTFAEQIAPRTHVNFRHDMFLAEDDMIRACGRAVRRVLENLRA